MRTDCVSSAMDSPSKGSTGKGVNVESNANITHDWGGWSVQATRVFLRITITGIAWPRRQNSFPLVLGSVALVLFPIIGPPLMLRSKEKPKHKASHQGIPLMNYTYIPSAPNGPDMCIYEVGYIRFSCFDTCIYLIKTMIQINHLLISTLAITSLIKP